MAGFRARARYLKKLLVKCRLKVLAWARRIKPLSAVTFRRATGYAPGLEGRLSVFLSDGGYLVV